MQVEEKEFRLRFSLEATFPDDYDGDEDQYLWLRDWSNRMKPQLLKMIFDALRQDPAWTARVRNRGLAPEDEIEIVLNRDFSNSP